jgi:DNA-binding MarR family transcriptional regulator
MPPKRRKGPVPPSLRIPYRILLHVARQGRVGPNEVPPDSLSQAGMVEALGVRQGAVAAALQRLVAAELLAVERSHVQGGERRLKVYRLTPRGEELVRDLRRRGRGKA